MTIGSVADQLPPYPCVGQFGLRHSLTQIKGQTNKRTDERTNERTNTQTNTIYYDDVEQRVYSSQTNYSRFAMVRVNQNYVAC